MSDKKNREILIQRRKHERNEVNLEVACNTDEAVAFEYTVDMSLGGVFLATGGIRPPLDVGTKVQLSFRIPGEDDSIFVHGEVRWISKGGPDAENPAGMGIRFLNLDPMAEMMLKNHFAKNTAKKS